MQPISPREEICIYSLPNETLIHVFKNLDFESIARVMKVCRNWRAVASDSKSNPKLLNQKLVHALKLYKDDANNALIRKIISTTRDARIFTLKPFSIEDSTDEWAGIGSESLDLVAKELTDLKVFKLKSKISSYTRITDALLSQIFKAHPNIEKLALEKCDQISEKSLIKYLSTLTKLSEITLSAQNVSTDLIEILKTQPNLKKITLKGSSVLNSPKAVTQDVLDELRKSHPNDSINTENFTVYEEIDLFKPLE